MMVIMKKSWLTKIHQTKVKKVQKIKIHQRHFNFVVVIVMLTKILQSCYYLIQQIMVEGNQQIGFVVIGIDFVGIIVTFPYHQMHWVRNHLVVVKILQWDLVRMVVGFITAFVHPSCPFHPFLAFNSFHPFDPSCCCFPLIHPSFLNPYLGPYLPLIPLSCCFIDLTFECCQVLRIYHLRCVGSIGTSSKGYECLLFVGSCWKLNCCPY